MDIRIQEICCQCSIIFCCIFFFLGTLFLLVLLMTKSGTGIDFEHITLKPYVIMCSVWHLVSSCCEKPSCFQHLVSLLRCVFWHLLRYHQCLECVVVLHCSIPNCLIMYCVVCVWAALCSYTRTVRTHCKDFLFLFVDFFLLFHYVSHMAHSSAMI